AEMTPLLELSHEHSLALIEDAAQAIGADDAQGRRAGSMSDVGCLSFFPSKNLGAFGDAGMCTTQDPELAEHMRVLRVHGGKPKYYHAFIGGNFRIDELQAAVLGIKIKYLDGWTAGRQRNADYYASAFVRAGLDAKIVAPSVAAGSRHIWNQYVIRATRRAQAISGRTRGRLRDLLPRAIASAAMLCLPAIYRGRLSGCGTSGRADSGAAHLSGTRAIPAAVRGRPDRRVLLLSSRLRAGRTIGP